MRLTAQPRDKNGDPAKLGEIRVVIEWDQNLAVVTEYTPDPRWIGSNVISYPDSGKVIIEASRDTHSVDPGTVIIGYIRFDKVGEGETDIILTIESMLGGPPPGTDDLLPFSDAYLNPPTLDALL